MNREQLSFGVAAICFFARIFPSRKDLCVFSEQVVWLRAFTINKIPNARSHRVCATRINCVKHLTQYIIPCYVRDGSGEALIIILRMQECIRSPVVVAPVIVIS